MEWLTHQNYGWATGLKMIVLLLKSDVCHYHRLKTRYPLISETSTSNVSSISDGTG
jgi:hypothetical protein